MLEADLAFHLVGKGALAGAELAAIAAGSTIAKTMRLDQSDRDAVFGEVTGGLKAGITAADDRDINLLRPVESGIVRPLADGCLIPG